MEGNNSSDRQKAALVRLSAGVGHEINNLVLAFDLNLDGLQDLSADHPDACELLSLVVDATDQARILATRLLAFAERQVLRPSSTDLNTFFAEIEPRLSASAGACRLTLTAASDAPFIRIDPTLFTNALLELVRNASEAGASHIEIRLELTSMREDGPDHIPGVTISVIDDGNGMNEQARAQSTDPFFTTKKGVKHLGLGLSETAGFIHQSGGTLSLESKIGSGTKVELFFPMSTLP